MARRERKSTERRRFPVVQAVVLLGVLWGSMWAAGLAGSYAGVYIYDDRYAPPAPYDAQQLQSLQRAAPEVARMAERDLELWRDNVSMGRSVASLEGALAATILLLAFWATGGVVWMWGRERQRAARSMLDFEQSDFA